jgi:hypothetical protein
MKMPRFGKLICGSMIIAMGVVSGGCRPSVREVADLLCKVPLDSSRDDLRKVLVQAYGKQYPNWKQSYALTDPPVKVTKQLIEGDAKLVADFKKDNHYVRVYPDNLFDKMPSDALTDSVGLVKEAANGNGFISIYYDNKTNYIGFVSCSSGH